MWYLFTALVSGLVGYSIGYRRGWRTAHATSAYECAKLGIPYVTGLLIKQESVGGTTNSQ